MEIVEERNWMFRLQKYKPQLLSFLRANPSWVPPFSFCDAADSLELPARHHAADRGEFAGPERESAFVSCSVGDSHRR